MTDREGAQAVDCSYGVVDQKPFVAVYRGKDQNAAKILIEERIRGIDGILVALLLTYVVGFPT